ncbi:hypothetical protein [Ideonella sp. YS5]|uniref:hypothetical protein n=1 Tax=Ideonella sp. YS5 TaxID=3453714 RepID=UPI003EE8F503
MGQIGFDTVVCLVPGVDTVMDIRDLIAAIIAIARAPTSGMAWFSLVLTLVGFLPELGSVAKGVVLIVFVKLRPLIKDIDDLTHASKMVKHLDEAFDAALPEIVSYLRHPKVQQFLTKAGVPDVVKWVSASVAKAAAAVDTAKLKALFDKSAQNVKDILNDLRPLLPDSAAARIKEVTDGILTVQRGFSRAVDSYMEPLRAMLRRLAERLDELHWVAYSQQMNKGWIAPLSEQGAKRLIAKHQPEWVKTKRPVLFEQLDPDDFRKEPAYVNGLAKGAPELGDSEIKSFAAGVKSRPLRDGETLYRVVDPTSGSLSTCWITESVWKEINANPEKARAIWRSRLAVKPDWNQNGTYVKFTYNKARDGDITVWEGTTSMQWLGEPDKVEQGFLEGGLTQVVWHPIERPPKVNQLKDATPDTFAIADPGKRGIQFPDMVEGGVIKDAAGEAQRHGVRAKINDPRIAGPFETGWGFKDFEDQHELIGLPNPMKE